MIIKQFDIWLADLNPADGTVPGKIRPVVIVQTDILNKINHPSTLVLPITSKIHETASLLRINLYPDFLNGLEKESAILIDQIRAVDNKKIIKKIGTVDNSHHNKIKKNLSIILSI